MLTFQLRHQPLLKIILVNIVYTTIIHEKKNIFYNNKDIQLKQT